MTNELYLHFLTKDEAIKFFGDIARKIGDMTDEPPLNTGLVTDLYYEEFSKRYEEYSTDELPCIVLVNCEDEKIKWAITSESSAPYGHIEYNKDEDESSVDWDKVKRFLKIAVFGLGCYILGRHQRRYRSLGKDKTIHIMDSKGLTDSQVEAINKFVDAQNKVWKDNGLSLVYDRKRK